MLTSKPN